MTLWPCQRLWPCQFSAALPPVGKMPRRRDSQRILRGSNIHPWACRPGGSGSRKRPQRRAAAASPPPGQVAAAGGSLVFLLPPWGACWRQGGDLARKRGLARITLWSEVTISSEPKFTEG